MADYKLSDIDVTQSSNKSKFCVVTGTTLKISSQETQQKEIKQRWSPCLACNKDGVTDTQVTTHPMFKCDLWNSLSYEEKTKLVKCI